ncbi:MAG TPA: IS1634 family transposase [Casimicrobiaceae bacterium]|nr:IS1634 family transposase [Casimicrobiaceae bacterium]
MAQRGGAVHVVTTRRRYKGREYTTHLLRRSYREGDKVKNETLGNLSHLPDHVVDLVRRSLRGEAFAPANERLEIVASKPHGDVDAVLRAMRRLDFASLLGSRPCREADLVMGMVAARIVAPDTKLATTRWWHTRTLAEDLDIAKADEDDLYAAMDWLLERQDAIQRKLAARHLEPGGLVLYDLSSSYFEGNTCPLAAFGHDRDGKKGKLQVNYGLLTDRRGCPVAVSVVKGNTGDSKTFLPQVRKLRDEFGLEHMVLVGDRGMISSASIAELREENFGWITALKSGQIRALVASGELQLGLFDERSLFELTHADFPDERLIACRNPELAKLRAHKRDALIAATKTELEKVRGMVARGKLKGSAAIGVRVGRVLNKYKVAKHFELIITDQSFDFAARESQIAGEAGLDGVYVIRTGLAKRTMNSADTVRNYKALSNVERAFRSLKTVDLKVRPIHHRLENRVRAHIFLCMLAYYVEWHMREAWREVLFADEDQDAKATRDPVAPARRSAAAEKKVRTRRLDDGTPTHSFRTLLDELSTIVRNTCHVPGGPSTATFPMVTLPNALQLRARELIDKITP